MSRHVRMVAVTVALAIALLGAVGCGDMAAKVETPENPAPAGTYEGVEVTSHISINDKANYAWSIGGTTYDAIADANTNYKVNGDAVSYSQFDDADSNEGSFEGENEDSFDDTYDFRVQPDGVLIEVDLITGD